MKEVRKSPYLPTNRHFSRVRAVREQCLGEENELAMPCEPHSVARVFCCIEVGIPAPCSCGVCGLE